MKYKLSYLAEIIGGGTPKTTISKYWGGTIPWLSVKDINNGNRYVYSTEKTITEEGLANSSTVLLQKDDIIISARGTIGEMASIPFPMAFNQSCYGLRAKREIVDADYLYYLVKFKVTELKHNSHGSVFDTITRDTFDGIVADIPEKEAQKKIGLLLTNIDKKIELNYAINNNLQAQAETLFADYFLKFDDIPFGWHKGCLLDIADYLNGLAMQKFRPKDGEYGLPVLKIKELRQGFCDTDSELCSPSIHSNYFVHDGDVIFSWSGSLLVDFWCGGDCGLNQHLFKVTSSRYEPWFYYLWTNYHLAKFVAIAADKATTMGHIKREDLGKAEVLIPNAEDYRKIGETLRPLLSLVISNRLENKKLSSLRDTLLPKLMSGEIDVSDVQI